MATGTSQSALGRANVALDRGRGVEAAQLLTPLLRSGALNKDDEGRRARGAHRGMAAPGRPDQAAAALGRTPDAMREPLPTRAWPRCGACTAA